MKIRANLHYKDKYTCDEECIIEKAVTIRSAEFDYLCKHLLEDNKYIKDNLDAMYYDGNKQHCLLLINESTGDGLLVNSEGSKYARCHSYIPNARQIVILNKYPVLNNFIVRMSEVAEDILSKATVGLSEDNDEYEVDVESYNKPGEPVIDAAMLDDILMDSGMVEDSILHESSIKLKFNRQIPDTRYRKCYNANDSTEIEIICAKHALWLYDERGGEQADFSNCLLENVDLSNRNLCAACFSGATLSNCNLDDASMCNANFRKAEFRSCSIRKFTAEEADFRDSDFYNCDLKGAYFTHSNFTNSEIGDCNTHGSNFTNCCLESCGFTDCDLDIANMSNVSYCESEWLDEDIGNEIQTQNMGGM